MREKAQGHYSECDPWQTADLVAFMTDRNDYKYGSSLYIPVPELSFGRANLTTSASLQQSWPVNNPGKQVYSLYSQNLAGSLEGEQSPFGMNLGVIFSEKKGTAPQLKKAVPE